MTATDLETLLAEARAILGGIQAIDGSRPVDRAEMESRIEALCARAITLPAAEAKQLAEPLSELVAALDGASNRIAETKATAESADRAQAGRRAAAAYGNAAGRGRRGR